MVRPSTRARSHAATYLLVGGDAPQQLRVHVAHRRRVDVPRHLRVRVARRRGPPFGKHLAPLARGRHREREPPVDVDQAGGLARALGVDLLLVVVLARRLLARLVHAHPVLACAASARRRRRVCTARGSEYA